MILRCILQKMKMFTDAYDALMQEHDSLRVRGCKLLNSTMMCTFLLICLKIFPFFPFSTALHKLQDIYIFPKGQNKFKLGFWQQLGNDSDTYFKLMLIVRKKV